MVIADMDKCTKSPTGEHVWNYTPRPDNCRLGTCRYCEQQRVFEGAIQAHTAAILKLSPVKPETLEKAAQIAEKSLLSDKMSYKLTPEQKVDIVRRLKAGAKVSEIAADNCVSDETIYGIRRQIGIHGSSHKKSKAVLKVEAVLPANPLRDTKQRSAPFDKNRKGNVMSQMGRLGRGEIKLHAAKSVLSSYKQMLEGDLKVTQSKARELKQKISAADDALNALDAISKGEKDIVEKVMASVK